ncbi:MAG: DUF2238 domain-containing protein [Nitrosarchaeum sp.]|nr:DUF2238 domain-containing protein [Nitrosarchaeum sp.]
MSIIIILFILIGLSLRHVTYRPSTLWGLTLWGFLHMAGGGLSWNGHRWYEIMFYTFSESYRILKYDQVIHFIGFLVATLVVWDLLRPHLTHPPKGHIALGITVVMAGLGLGALNEIVEFSVSIATPHNGVGDLTNMGLDLISNLLGALTAWIIILAREKRALQQPHTPHRQDNTRRTRKNKSTYALLTSITVLSAALFLATLTPATNILGSATYFTQDGNLATTTPGAPFLQK